ncbi:hypothetical protein ACFQAV_11095 [Companilactobacillus huachuanensis]|uniref:Uncharacterized protein n=1 Tax=Companilactobacillus huachuanensis TaxID=2559914 RepID=A0ABW1RMZ6_9LACO|nr:hypothetical protein [Companilactobacillus huachuanensis]
MKNTTKEQDTDESSNQSNLTNNWITSEVLVGMYSRIFTNILSVDDRIFKGHSK